MLPDDDFPHPFTFTSHSVPSANDEQLSVKLHWVFFCVLQTSCDTGVAVSEIIGVGDIGNDGTGDALGIRVGLELGDTAIVTDGTWVGDIPFCTSWV